MEFEVPTQFWGLVPLTLALVALAKLYIDPYWAPLASVAIGFGLSVLVTDLPLAQTIIPGLIVGTSAAGLFSGVKTMIK